MIAYRDFAPRQLTSAGMLKQATFESLDETLTAANDWIQANALDVLNVETIIMPNNYSAKRHGTADAEMITQSEFAIAWNKFIRVWYRQSQR
jgi:hypothetical protein